MYKNVSIKTVSYLLKKFVDTVPVQSAYYFLNPPGPDLSDPNSSKPDPNPF
jgi:hypothetical protein